MRVVEVVRTIAPRCGPNYLQAFEHGDALFASHKLLTPLRVAHFLAQALYETGRGTVLFENLKYRTADRLLFIFGVGRHSAAIRPEEVPGLLGNDRALAERVYGLGNPRKADELGNHRAGDAYRYRGGGLLQTTGGANYKKMGDIAGVDFYSAPELVVEPEYALLPALAEWRLGGLNAYADQNDIRTITRIINGGYNGLEGRIELFGQIWPVVQDANVTLDAWQAALPTEDTVWLQEGLNTLGASPAVIVDGRYGPETAEAVKWFQQLAHIPVDGNAGIVTRAAMKLRLEAA